MNKPNDSNSAGLGNNNPPSEITQADKPKLKCKRQRCFMTMAILFLVSTAVFTGLFVYYYTMSDNAGGVATTAAEICNTPDCVITAASMAKNMNLTADPCEDFSEFACGRFYKESKFRVGARDIGTFYTISEANKGVLKEIITEEMIPGDPHYLTNMKRYYRACLDEDQIEKVGVEPFFNETDLINDWPTLNPAWNDSHFNLSDVIVRYAASFTFPLFGYTAIVVPYIRPALQILPPSLGLPFDYYLKPDKEKDVRAYQTYLAEIAVALGADADVAAEDAKDVVGLKKTLAMMVLSGMNSSQDALFSPFTLSQLRAMYPNLDIPGVIATGFLVTDVPLPDDLPVVSSVFNYLANLNKQINTFSSRTLRNLFGFWHAVLRVDDKSRRVREISNKFLKVVNGKIDETPRWESCLSETSSTFQEGIDRQYIVRTFTEKSKTYVEEMVVNLKGAFRQTLEESSWLRDTTKEQAYKKLDAMEYTVGYPDDYADDVFVEAYYEQYAMTADNYYANIVLRRKLVYMRILNVFHESDITRLMDLVSLMAGYYVSYNKIDISAGFLQPPIFSLIYPQYVNYGAIGTIIGHEITHGFDDFGSQYDADGWPNNWWQDDDRSEFLNRTQCLVDQYSGFYVEEINMHVNGTKTLGENLSDNVGIKQSFRAYKELVKRTGEQPTLPGLGLTQDQIFFLSHAQVWCIKHVEPVIRLLMTIDPHSPDRYRIIGTLQNSEEFAKAYNCPLGSFMNPKKKCTVY